MKILYRPFNINFKIGKWYKYENKLKLHEPGFSGLKDILDIISYRNVDTWAKIQVKGNSITGKGIKYWSEMKIVKTFKWLERDSVNFAIYVAELVLPNFEKEIPDDKRPREAIEAAKKVLKNNNEKNRNAAWSAVSMAWSAASMMEGWNDSSAAFSAASAANAASAASAVSMAWSIASVANAARNTSKVVIKAMCIPASVLSATRAVSVAASAASVASTQSTKSAIMSVLNTLTDAERATSDDKHYLILKKCRDFVIKKANLT